MDFQNILTETQGAIQTITINRPNQLNALNKLIIKRKRTAPDESFSASAS